MNVKLQEFLKEINGGKERGAKAKLARDLGLSDATITMYCNSRTPLSEQAVISLATKYNKTEEEICEIFGMPNRKSTIQQNNFQNRNCNISQFGKSMEVELVKSRLETMDVKIENLAAKMDNLASKMELLIRMFKGV